jgi:hypothetical protein
MTDEKNTAAMALSETRELLQDEKGFRGPMKVEARARVAVERIENQEAGMGSLECIFEDGGIAEVEGGRWRGDGSAQDSETPGIAKETGEARLDDF